MSISRAELYGFDSKGRPIKSMRNADVKCRSCRVPQRDCPRGNGKRCCDECWHPQVMRAKSGSSPPIVDLFPAETLRDEEIEAELLEMRAKRKAKMDEALATLTPDERAVLDLQTQGIPETQTRDIPVQELVDALEDGWQLERQASGEATVSRVVYLRPSYDEIATRLGLTPRQVHRRVAAANKKLRSAKQ